MRLLPRTLFGRLVLLMATGLVTAQLIGATLHLAERRRTIGTTVSHEFAQRVAGAYRAVDNQQGDERPRLAQLLNTQRQLLTVEAAAPAMAIRNSWPGCARRWDRTSKCARSWCLASAASPSISTCA